MVANLALSSRTGDEPTLPSLEQARRIASLAQDKLAQDVVILDMRPACSYTDYFVVCTGQNSRQTAAIYNEVHSGMKHDGRLLPCSVDGQIVATCISADFHDDEHHYYTPMSLSTI